MYCQFLVTWNILFPYNKRQFSRLIDPTLRPLPSFPVVISFCSQNTVTSSHRIHTCFSFHRIHLPKRFLRHLFSYPIFFLYHKASQAKNQPFFAWLPYFLTADVLLILLRSVQTGKPVQYQIPFCSRSCLPYSCDMQLLRMLRSLLP